jgi:DNA-directed RNA polymerase subunit RPC12/RpoP
MTILKCGKCGDTINEEENHAFIDPFTKEERVGCVHDCSIIDDPERVWAWPDRNDGYGIQGTKIWKNRDKIPNIEECKRCGVRVALIENHEGELDYYEMHSGRH